MIRESLVLTVLYSNLTVRSSQAGQGSEQVYPYMSSLSTVRRAQDTSRPWGEPSVPRALCVGLSLLPLILLGVVSGSLK